MVVVVVNDGSSERTQAIIDFAKSIPLDIALFHVVLPIAAQSKNDLPRRAQFLRLAFLESSLSSPQTAMGALPTCFSVARAEQ